MKTSRSNPQKCFKAGKETKRTWTLFVYVPLIKSRHTFKEIFKTSTVLQFKCLIEIICGVPAAIQRLHYLDMSDLQDECVLSTLDVVNKAMFALDVWKRWQPMLEFVYCGDYEKLSKSFLIDTKESGVIPMIATFQKRCETTLFVAAKFGHIELLQKLVDLGVNINACTESGYSALHVAIANGKYKNINFLLHNGAKSDTKKSTCGKHALSIANQYGFQESEQHLCLFNWQLRAAKKAKSKPSGQENLMMHQQFDSKTPTWLNGMYGTKYLCKTLPCKEFSGTRIDAPKVKPVEMLYTNDEDYFAKTDSGSARLKNYITYEAWKQRKANDELIAKENYDMLVQQRQQEAARAAENKKLSALRRQQMIEERTLNAKEVISGRQRQKEDDIHEEFVYLPCYTKMVMNSYMNDQLNAECYKVTGHHGE